MSGIYGIFNRENNPIDQNQLNILGDVMQVWGEDGQHQWLNHNIGLGHVPLHIAPHSKFDIQPYHDPICDELVITADSRLDNRTELIHKLNLEKTQTNSITDAAIILASYKKWGQDCVTHLLGAFAFAIWEGHEKSLFCARDHFGIRPFVYFTSAEWFIFASDIEAVLTSPLVPKKFNLPLISAHLQQCTLYARKSQTFFENIYKIPSAHTMVITQDDFHKERFWSANEAPEIRFAQVDDYAAHLRELLHKAVACRLLSDFQIGAHVSGGLDSAAIVYYAHHILKRQGKELGAVYSWSPSFQAMPKQQMDERVYTEEICRSIGIECAYIDTSVDDYVNIWSRDFTRQPRNMLIREQYVLTHAQENNIRVILSGWGGDEGITTGSGGLLAELFIQGKWRALHQRINKVISKREVPNLLVFSKRYLSIIYHHILFPLIPNSLLQYFDPRQTYGALTASFIHPDFSKSHREKVLLLRRQYHRELVGLKNYQIMRLTRGHLEDRIESWTKEGAMYQVEHRYPLLDKRVIEFALGIPPELYSMHGYSRYLFRKAIQDVVPDIVTWRHSKREIASMDTFIKNEFEALPTLYNQNVQSQPDHLAHKFVDVARLERIVLSNNMEAAHIWAIHPALACFTIEAAQHDAT